jgi:hypothetical protein
MDAGLVFTEKHQGSQFCHPRRQPCINFSHFYLFCFLCCSSLSLSLSLSPFLSLSTPNAKSGRREERSTQTRAASAVGVVGANGVWLSVRATSNWWLRHLISLLASTTTTKFLPAGGGPERNTHASTRVRLCGQIDRHRRQRYKSKWKATHQQHCLVVHTQ